MVRKAVIPAAGFGTRMLPAAKAVPKEMLPVVDRPVIQWVVEEAAAAGIDDVLLVTSRDKRAVEDHFDRTPELEARLAATGRSELLASIAALAERAKLHATRQPEQRGLGDAVYQARRHVGDEPFLCLLGDTIFSGEPSPSRQLIDLHRELGGTIIALEEVGQEKVSRYGVVGGPTVREGVVRVETIVEKPRPAEAPSRLAVAARYVLSPRVFECLERIAPGAGGELQLTDALRLLVAEAAKPNAGEPVHGVVVRARRHDVGNPVDWLKTNLLLAARDEALWAQVAPLARELLG